MNLKTIYLTLLLAVSVSSLFAADYEDLNKNVVESFQREFTTAKKTRWSVVGPLKKATFELNGKEMYAYYTETGEKYASARNIHVSEVSASLMNRMKSVYQNYWITEAFEVDKNDRKTYYIPFENADQKVILSTNGKRSWVVSSKKAKE